MRKLLDWFKSLFYAKPLAEEVTAAAEPKAPKLPKVRMPKAETDGYAMTKLSNILDLLDDYFAHTKKLKSAAPDAYALYSKLGAQLIPDESFFEIKDLAPQYKTEDLPFFGAIHFIDSKKAKKDQQTMHPKLMYLMKYNKKWQVQYTNGQIYEVGVIYKDEKFDRVIAAPFYMSVVDGECKLLKQKQRKYNDKAGFSYWSMGFPDFLQSDKSERTPEEYAHFMFTMVANAIVNQANSGFQVRCSKNSATACFTIDMLRTPYFFKDRTIKDGEKKKKIFHIVRTHKRNLKTGVVKNIKTHFRGVRNFTWHGYNVNITLPGYHHRPLSELSADVYEADRVEKNTLTADQAGKMLQQAIGI